MGALTWIGLAARWLGAFIPTCEHVECWEAAVAVKRGKKKKALSPGIWWYWPYWTTIHKRPANRQTRAVRAQQLLTKDQKAVAAGCMVRFYLNNPVAALVETEDVESSIDDEMMAVLCEFITQRELAEIQVDRVKVNTALTKKARSQLKDYGVYVERAQLTDFVPGQALIHIGLPQVIEIGKQEE